MNQNTRYPGPLKQAAIDSRKPDTYLGKQTSWTKSRKVSAAKTIQHHAVLNMLARVGLK